MNGTIGRCGYADSFDIATTIADAQQLVPVILELTGTIPQTVVDVGGGTGIWCREFSNRGVPEAFCIDHPSLAGNLVIPASEFIGIDLAKEFPAPIRADLAVCLEVAEHLPAERSEALIEFLTQCANVILFSAAIPGQGGQGHVNEQLPRYWAAKFLARGYSRIDAIRPMIVDNPTVSFWYRQNLTFYARAGAGACLLKPDTSCVSIPDDFVLVHESIVASWLRLSSPPGVMGLARAIPAALFRAVARRVKRRGTW